MSRRLVNKFGDIENIENSEYFVQVMRDISPKWDYWEGRKYLMINYIWSNIKFSLDLNWFNPVLTDLNFRSCLLSVLSDISLSIEIVRSLLDLEKYFTMNCNLWFINHLTFPKYPILWRCLRGVGWWHPLGHVKSLKYCKILKIL